jgi:AcrR family transcriptional regulator
MQPPRPRRGRTPTLDPEKIANAVRRVAGRGKGLTMQAVAAALGVNVTTLYRHVGGTDALRQIGARLAAPAVGERPTPEGKTWQVWLAELARYYRVALRENPDLVEYVHSALDPEFEGLEDTIRILVGMGFDPRTAGFAHGFVMNNVVGYVYQEQRENELTAQGNSVVARFVQAVLADRGVDRLATLKSLALGAADFEPDAAFERFLQYTIDGIAAQPGAPRVTRRSRSSRNRDPARSR